MKKKNSNSKPVKNSGNNKNSNKNSRRGRKRQQVRSKKSLSRTSAPIAVSDDLQQNVSFKTGRSDGSLLMTACVPLYQICSNSFDTITSYRGGFTQSGLATANFPYVGLSCNGGHYIVGTTDSLVNYLSPVFQLLSNVFTRYRVLKCKFIYEPQSATTVADRLVFAYANDPQHPLVQQAQATATQSKLLACQDSVAFMPWRSWELDVSSNVKQDLLYTYNQSTTTSADNRFNMFGSMGCVPSVTYTSTQLPIIYGILYAELTFEFIEFCPLLTSFTPVIAIDAESETLKKESNLAEKKEEEISHNHVTQCRCNKCINDLLNGRV